MRLRCGAQLFEVELRPAGGEWLAQVNGEPPLRLTLEEIGDGRAVVRHDGARRTLHFARDAAALYLFWDGVSFKLEQVREGARRAARPETGALEAPMPGRVSAVKVAKGARVRKGDELLVVEAMKMENALRAPRDGVVRALNVSVGEMVAPGRALVELADDGEGA
jgi:3-methylcrotonyl-CoA carboxylase alpha subunit